MYHCPVAAERVGTYFDEIAGAYRDERYGPGADPWRAYFFGQRLLHALDLMGPVRGRLLDLGSGPGVLGQVCEGGVVHLDVSPAMLREAGGDAVLADALRIPLRDGSVEAVAALGLTTYLPDLDALLSEVHRVLEPGGRLILSVTRRGSPDTVLRALFRQTLGRLGRGRGLLRSGVGVRSWSDGETVRALHRHGLRVRRTRLHNFTLFPLCYLAKGWSVRLARRLEGAAPRALRGIASDRLLLAEKTGRPRAPTKVRVARVIARLNVGGPARQSILLTERLDPDRFASTLITGQVEPHEADLLPEARERGLAPVVIDGLGRTISPLDDLRAFLRLLGLLDRERPAIVHTHTAKAGALGRVAALLASVPVRVHTFHGHVLHGYFGRAGSALARAAELVLARLSTRVVAVSEEVKADLVERHRIAPPSRVDVVPLGLDL
ncbi:MAG: glycosyltransferase, partial [Planctomycetota bacterium]